MYWTGLILNNFDYYPFLQNKIASYTSIKISSGYKLFGEKIVRQMFSEIYFSGAFTKICGLNGPFLQKAYTWTDHIWDLGSEQVHLCFDEIF